MVSRKGKFTEAVELYTRSCWVGREDSGEVSHGEVPWASGL